MSFSSRSSSLTPCQSPSPEFPIVQPDHFYGSEGVQLPPSPRSDGKTWLDPDDDAAASRGIPVFKPTIEEFADFEAYMERVNCWGMRSGIVKVIPPKEWTESLPDIKPQLRDVKIKSPIEQVMLGSGGLFRQQNMEKRKTMSVREWAEWCSKDEYKAPAKQDIGLDGRGARMSTRTARRGRKKGEPSSSHDVAINGKDNERTEVGSSTVPSPPPSEGPGSPKPTSLGRRDESKIRSEPKAKGKRAPQTREERQASLADRTAKDDEFVDAFEPHQDWLPLNTTGEDYNPEYCQKLERHFWRNCGLGKSPWYGADTQGTLFTDDDKIWNVGRLPSALSRLLPSSDKGLPGVNTPYLYFGMWRATFAWHVEDMDLYSINYIHFGAPKFWYAIPQAKADSFETVMRGLFPDARKCPQFLRHKSYLASPMTLAKSNCRPNYLVQQEGEFVITYPRGYHAGFNLGFNCAESVNFALECWIEMGRVAKACKCVSDSVRIDVDQLLQDRAEEAMQVYKLESSTTSKSQRGTKRKDSQPPVKQESRGDVIPLLKIPLKRKVEDSVDLPKAKKIRLKSSLPKSSGFLKNVAAHSTAPASNVPPAKMSVKLKLGPKPAEQEPFPCCLCVSMDRTSLLRVQDPPLNRKDALDATGNPKIWMAHEQCASIIPETWVDEHKLPGGSKAKVVRGVDAIVKDRWNLKCSACSKSRSKAHGAPVQCTKGKCPKAFHVSCAREGHDHGIIFSIVREVEKEVVLMQLQTPPAVSNQMQMQVDPTGQFFVSEPSQPEAEILKRIKKLEYQILCPQHNPALAAQKKASKQEKIKNDLLALPIMSRIKIRVSSGVFEVSLMRVIEETGSVEVLWDRGLHREFKWGCVVFGSTDGPVQQRPTEDQTPVESRQTHPPHSRASRETTATPTASASISSTPTITIPAIKPPTSSHYPYGTVVNASWSYTPQQVPYGYAQGGYGWTYPAFYQTPYPSPARPHPQAYQSGGLYTNRDGRLQWQRPYEGPSNSQVISNSMSPSSTLPANASLNGEPSEAGGIPTYSQGQANASPPSGAPPISARSHTLSSEQHPSSFRPPDRGVDATPQKISATAPGPDFDPSNPSRPVAMSAPLSQFPDLSALMKLSQAELSELLNKNPQLSHYIMASIQQHNPSSSEANAYPPSSLVGVPQ